MYIVIASQGQPRFITKLYWIMMNIQLFSYSALLLDDVGYFIYGNVKAMISSTTSL